MTGWHDQSSVSVLVRINVQLFDVSRSVNYRLGEKRERSNCRQITSSSTRMCVINVSWPTDHLSSDIQANDTLDSRIHFASYLNERSLGNCSDFFFHSIERLKMWMFARQMTLSASLAPRLLIVLIHLMLTKQIRWRKNERNKFRCSSNNQIRTASVLFDRTEQKDSAAVKCQSQSRLLDEYIRHSHVNPFLFLLLLSSSSFLIGCVESLVLPPIVAILINHSVWRRRRRADDIEWKEKKRKRRIDSYLN